MSGATAKDRHIHNIVGYLLRGDSASAVRYYTQNRVSMQTFKEAKARAHRLLARAKA